MGLLFCQENGDRKFRATTACADDTINPFRPTPGTSVCVCLSVCLPVLVCVCVTGRWEAVVCSSVYFVGVLSLPATAATDQGETRKRGEGCGLHRGHPARSSHIP